jgi:hypothetical protein
MWALCFLGEAFLWFFAAAGMGAWWAFGGWVWGAWGVGKEALDFLGIEFAVVTWGQGAKGEA